MKKREMMLVFLLIVLISSWLAAQELMQNEVANEDVLAGSHFNQRGVTGLRVEDFPNDNGTGLIVSWEPLPKEARIIEYRIYRGVSPDTLFHIGSVEVEPKIGVTAPRMVYYDRGFSGFVDHYSPARLRKEVKRDAGSPLYGKMPRDFSIFTKYLSHYSVLGEISLKYLFHKSQPVIVRDESGEDEEPEAQVYAGLSFRGFEGLYAMLLPQHTYYYAVVAIDQQRRFLPHSEIVPGQGFPNPPEQPSHFAVTVLADLELIQFEWSDPIFNDDIIEYRIHICPKESLQQMNQYIQAKIADPMAERTIPATLIYSSNDEYEDKLPYLTRLSFQGGAVPVSGSEEVFRINTDNWDNYLFFLSLHDYNGFVTYSDELSPRLKSASDLPSIPNYVIGDKEDDLGDYNQILLERPLVFLTQGSFTSSTSSVLSLNYDFTDNKSDRVKTIIFRFYDSEGNHIGEINEFFPDKVIKLRLKDREIVNKGISAVMIPNTTLNSYDDSINLRQDFSYDREFGFIRFDELSYNGHNISDFRYLIYKRSRSNPDFGLAQTVSPFSRAIDDNVPYEKSAYRMISRADDDKKLLLFDSSISIGYDYDNNIPISTTIFQAKVQDEIVKLQRKADEELEENNGEPGYYASLLRHQTEHSDLAAANTIENHRQRIRFLANARAENNRSISYRFVKTDGKGLFVIDDVYSDEHGNEYLKPISNWFNKTKLPTLIATTLFALIVFVMMNRARKNPDMYIRPIAGLEEIDNAIGRATEMGRPILYVPGIGYIEDIATLASLSILSKVAVKAAEYDTKLIVPLMDYIVMPIAMETVKEAYAAAGRPDAFNQDNIFYIAGEQFAYVAGVNGIMAREKVATNFFLGVFFAEALLMTEAGNALGAVQIAGSDSITQIPFFITTCDYTLIGEELYGASAYLSREPNLLGNLKAMDYAKLIILILIITGTFLSTFRMTFFINAFPSQ